MVVWRVEVCVLDGLQADFEHRHRKDHRATEVWQALVARRAHLEADPFSGDAIPHSLWPRQYREFPTLFRLALPHGFRALYTATHEPGRRHLVVIEWLGDHKEYDRLFGYSTS